MSKTNSRGPQSRSHEAGHEAGYYLPKYMPSAATRAARISIFPAYKSIPSQEKFANSAEACHWRENRIVRDEVIQGDKHDLAHLMSVQGYWVGRVYDAIVETSCINDNPGFAYSSFVHLENKASPYSSKQIQAAAWQLIDIVIEGSIRGFLACTPNGYVPSETERNLKCLDRIIAICRCLREEKTACRDVIKGELSKLQALVYAPHAYARSKANRRNQNRKRDRISHARLQYLSSSGFGTPGEFTPAARHRPSKQCATRKRSRPPVFSSDISSLEEQIADETTPTSSPLQNRAGRALKRHLVNVSASPTKGGDESGSAHNLPLFEYRI